VVLDLQQKAFTSGNNEVIVAAQRPSQADNPPIRWLGGGAAVGGSELLGGTAAAPRSLRIFRQSRQPPRRIGGGT